MSLGPQMADISVNTSKVGPFLTLDPQNFQVFLHVRRDQKIVPAQNFHEHRSSYD